MKIIEKLDENCKTLYERLGRINDVGSPAVKKRKLELLRNLNLVQEIFDFLEKDGGIEQDSFQPVVTVQLLSVFEKKIEKLEQEPAKIP